MVLVLCDIDFNKGIIAKTKNKNIHIKMYIIFI
jgi:hypothetical protein